MPVALRRVSAPGWVAVTATAAFVLVSLWWLLSDGRIPFFDSGAHQFTALTYRDGFGDGHPWLWFTANNPPTYPPLVHLVGALGTVVGGISTTAMVLSLNVVFVPALAAGCYGAGTLLYDRRAGALAAIFALGSPLIVSQFHLFMLDAPQTAAIALAVWLLLASKRFANPRLSLLAGLATGFALMTKNTSAVFLVGLIGVALLRGGWRNWRGWALYAAGALVIAGAWYAVHLRDMAKFAGGAAVSGSSALQFDPPAFSFADLTWYVWDAVNWQLYLPLCLLVLAGIVPAVRRALPRPTRDDQMPELLAGCLVGWFVIDLLANNDPRYTMPCLVYLAVIGTGWTTQLASRTWRRIAMGAVVAASVVTFVVAAFGVGPKVEITLAHHDPPRDNGEGTLTVLNPDGFLVGGPEAGGRLVDVLKDAHAAGARRMAIERNSAGAAFFNAPGLSVAAREAGLQIPPGNEYTALGPDDVYLVRTDHGAVDAPPCTTVPDGDVYLLRGPDVRPLAQAQNLWCPGRSPQTYAAAGAAEAQRPSAADRRLRDGMERILHAAREQGIRQVFFEDSIASAPWFGGAKALYDAAGAAGLQPPAQGELASLSPQAGIYVYIGLKQPSFPESCLHLPNGDGVFLIKGTNKQTLPYADNLYCPTRTPSDYKAPLAS